MRRARVVAPFAIVVLGACDVNQPVSIPRAQPTPVVVAGGQHFRQISAGFLHTCAVDMNGALWCWGDDDYLQSGVDSASASACNEIDRCVLRPTKLAGTVVFDSVSAGQQMSCALSHSGDAYCWGGGYVNHSAYLGNGEFTSSAAPLLVSGGLHFTSVQVGGAVACGLSTTQRVYCWGNAGFVGDSTRNAAAVPVAVSGGRTYRALAVGSSHACAVTTDSLTFCWGGNSLGQLGTGSYDVSPGSSTALSPVRALIDGAVSVSAGGGHTCVVRAHGDVWCWGDNGVFQVGVESAAGQVTTPTRIQGTGQYAQVSAGQAHSCALGVDGVVSCWGGNWFGALGDGGSTAAFTSEERPTPKPIVSTERFVQVSAGGSHTCALATDGRAWCWGDRGLYQLGDR